MGTLYTPARTHVHAPTASRLRCASNSDGLLLDRQAEQPKAPADPDLEALLPF